MHANHILGGGGCFFFLFFLLLSFLLIPALSPSAHVGTEEEMESSKAGAGRESTEGLHGSCSELQCCPRCSSPPTPADFGPALPVLLPAAQSTPGIGRENRGHSQPRFINTFHFSTGHFTVPNFPGNVHNMVGLHQRRMTIRRIFFSPSPPLGVPFWNKIPKLAHQKAKKKRNEAPGACCNHTGSSCHR